MRSKGAASFPNMVLISNIASRGGNGAQSRGGHHGWKHDPRTGHSLSVLRPGSAGAWPSQCRESCSRAMMTDPPRQNAGVGNIPNRAMASLGHCTRPSRHCGRPLPPPASTPALRMEKSRPSLHDPTPPRQSPRTPALRHQQQPPYAPAGEPPSLWPGHQPPQKVSWPPALA